MNGEPLLDRGASASRQLLRPDCNIVPSAWDEWLSLLVAGFARRQTIPKSSKANLNRILETACLKLQCFDFAVFWPSQMIRAFLTNSTVSNEY